MTSVGRTWRTAPLAIWALFAPLPISCSASDAIKNGTKCQAPKCPVGAQSLEKRDATGSCSASGSYKPGENEVGAGGTCLGSGDCETVCLYPACKEGQNLVITSTSFSCSNDVCAAVDCAGHGRCRNNNGQAQCVCDDGYFADGTQCVSGGSPPGETGGSSGDGAGGDTSASGGTDSATSGRPPGGTGGLGAGGATSSSDAGSQTAPGDTPDTALKLGALGSAAVKITDGYVGGSETKDFYQFSLPQDATVDYRVDVRGASATVNLYRNRTVIDESAPYATASASVATAAVVHILLEKGVYYLRVTPVSGGPLYSLNLSATLYEPYEPAPEPGVDASSAYDVGTLSSMLQQVGGYVGGTDSKDYYKLELSTNTTLSLSVVTADMSRVLLRLYPDSPTIDESSSMWQIDSMAHNVDTQNIAAGTYYVLVTPYPATTNALYTLGLYTN